LCCESVTTFLGLETKPSEVFPNRKGFFIL